MKNRTAISQIVMVLSVLFVGVALGHWMTTGISESVSAAGNQTAAKASAPKPDDTASLSTSSADLTKSTSTASGPKKSLDDILKSRNSRDRTKELQDFVANLGLCEFGAALKRLRQMPEGNARELASRLLIARWAEVDPNGALQFAAQNHEFDYVASDVFQQLAADDLQGALARAQNIPDPTLRYQALRGVLSFMADQDPMGALRLAATFGQFPNEEPLSQAIYRQWSSYDPQAAAAAAAQDPSGGGWRSPIGQVLRNWASQDPLAAINWSTSLTDLEAQARDIGQIMRQWSRDDLNAASNWVNSAAPGPIRDAAAAALAFSLAGSDPQSAINWVESIADPTQRNSALERLSREIVNRDPANGAALLAAAGVPANMIPQPAPDGQRRGRRGP